MKVVILTLPFHTNYGGILQAYALQQVLIRLGNQPIHLNRAGGGGLSFNVKCLRILSVIKCLIRKYILRRNDIMILNPFSPRYTIYKAEYEADEKLRSFIHNNICQTQLLRDSKSLSKYMEQHKDACFIVGSDQVWREEYAPCISDYFGAFFSPQNKTKRIAYAASFGNSMHDISSDKLNECIRALKKFDAISVREESGRNILQSVFSLDAKVVLDPTLLLSDEDYWHIIENKDRNINPGLTSYILDVSNDKQQIVDNVADILNLLHSPLSMHFCGEKIDSVSHWLASIANAQFVVTDSFHGCVFSIIFKKPFIAIANSDRGLDRFYSLLDSIGLRNRLVFSYEEFKRKKNELLEKIDYDKVNRKKQELTADSLYFLQKSLAS